MKTLLCFLPFLLVFAAMGQTTVWDIQFSTDGASPLDGETVTVSAVVTGVGYDGDKYFIGDADGGPWSGVYVFDYSNSPGLGDEITITALVYEYYELTELKDVSAFSIDGSGTVPDPYLKVDLRPKF